MMKKLFSISLLFFSLFASAQTIKQKQVESLSDSLGRKVDTSQVIKINMDGDSVGKAVLSNGDGVNFHLGNVVASGGSTTTIDSVGRVQFTVGVTTNSPAAGDSVLTIPALIGKYVKVYRYGELQKFSSVWGIEVDTSVGAITFHPDLVENEDVIIEGYDYAAVIELTLPSPPPSWTDLTFTTNTGLTQTSNVWTPTTDNSWDQYGLDDLTLTGDGSYRFKYDASDGDQVIIGFNASNTSEGFANYEYGIYLADGGDVNAVVNGTPSSISYTLSVGDYIMLNRTGSTFTIQTSPDGSTWTTRYTFAATSSATHYVNIDIYGSGGGDGKCYYPQGLGLN